MNKQYTLTVGGKTIYSGLSRVVYTYWCRQGTAIRPNHY